MNQSLSDNEAIERIKAALEKQPRLRQLIVSALMEMTIDQITEEACEDTDTR